MGLMIKLSLQRPKQGIRTKVIRMTADVDLGLQPKSKNLDI